MFDHSSYSKKKCNYHLFYCHLIYHVWHEYFYICTKNLNKTNGQTLFEKSTASYIKIRREYVTETWMHICMTCLVRIHTRSNTYMVQYTYACIHWRQVGVNSALNGDRSRDFRSYVWKESGPAAF